MNASARLSMSVEEYLAWEPRQERRHELVDGVVRLMAGGTRAHFEIGDKARDALKARLRGGPCRVYGADFRVQTPAGNHRYPDGVVDCAPRGPRDLAASKPTLIVEVLSPSTEFFDLTVKLEDYQSIDSVQHILVLSQTRQQARVWTREAGGGWRTADSLGSDGVLAFALAGFSIPLSEIYDGVELTPEASEEG